MADQIHRGPRLRTSQATTLNNMLNNSSEKIDSVPRAPSSQARPRSSPTLRKRNSPPSNRKATRRHPNHNRPIGGYNHSDNDSESDSTYRSRASRGRRHEIRRRLYREQKEGKIPLRLPWTKWMNSSAKNHTVAFIGEFVGTFMFLFFAFAGTQVANIGSGNSTNGSTTGSATGFSVATLLYIALSFGFSLMVNAWIFYRISGGLFNPAVTLALALLGALDPIRAVLLFIAQITGACFSSYIVMVLFPTTFNVRTTLASDTTLAQGLFIEAICTAELVFTIIMLAAEKHRATFIAPVGIGLALFISELVAVYYTGGSLNPARSFGPAAVTHQFDSEHWIYWIGPLIGTLLAVGYYKLNKILEYEMANPGQDGDESNDPTRNPDHEVAQAAEERELEVEEINAVEEAGGFENVDVDEDGQGEGETMEADAGDLGDVERIRSAHDLEMHTAHPGNVPMKGMGSRGNRDDLEAQWPVDQSGQGRAHDVMT